MRLLLPRSVVGLDAYADLYVAPNPDLEAPPLLLWIGGAISFEEYDRRRATEPSDIVEEFRRGTRRLLADETANLLVVSAPPTLLESSARIETFHRFVVSELLPAVEVRLERPFGAVGLIGNSFGAHLLSGLLGRLWTPGHSRIRAFATIAGVGLWEAMSADNLPSVPSLPIRCYVNDEDLAGLSARELQRELTRRGGVVEVIERCGTHAFADYAANGSVADAFTFLLGALERCHDGRAG